MIAESQDLMEIHPQLQSRQFPSRNELNLNEMCLVVNITEHENSEN